MITDRSVNTVRQFLNDLRGRMVSSIYTAVDDDETAGILAAICTGDRSGLTDETRTVYGYSGIIHILAVSGLHISLIGMSIFKLLRKKFRYVFSAAVSLMVMICFCIMSSSSPSAVRATIMFAVQIAGTGLGKNYDILCSLSLAVILMLFFEPYLIFNSGFLLSAAAIASVGIIFRTLRDLFTAKNAKQTISDGAEQEINAAGSLIRRTMLRMLPGVIMSISINLGTLPLIAYIYYEIPLYSVMLNIIIIPMMSGILGAGLFSAMMGMISIIIGRFFAGSGVYMIRFIKWACLAVSELPCSRIVTGCPSIWRLCCYYLMMIIGTAAVNVYLRNVRNRGKIRYRIISFVTFTVCSVFILFWRIRGDSMKILFLDVGQGDCILIESPSGTNYMLDGGSSSVSKVAKYRIAGTVKYEGISVIDYVIITHPDADHTSGIMEIMESMDDKINALNIKIKNILIPFLPENDDHNRLISAAGEHGVNVIKLRTGISIDDQSLRIRCLHPDTDYRSEKSNGYSAVMELDYGEYSALFTGDLEADGESIILAGERLEDSGYDLLKVSHHGSRNSSTQEFLRAVSPDVAVISAGTDNPYGHPHAETLERLNDAGSTVYATNECGEIIITAGQNGRYTIETKF